MKAYGCQSMVRPLKKVLVKRPEEAFESQERIDGQWRSLDYLARPDFDRAVEEHQRFTALLEGAGAEVACLPADGRTGLDALYTHDPVASVTDQGVILGRMGKDARMKEPDAMADWFAGAGIPVAGRIEPPGSVEGGDVVWLKDDLAIIGLTYRTNGEGIRQFQALLQPRGIDVVAVPMVHWDGPGAVLHLMSVISPAGYGPCGRLRTAPAHPVPGDADRPGHRPGGGAGRGVRQSRLQRAGRGTPPRDRAKRQSGYGGPHAEGRLPGRNFRRRSNLLRGQRRADLPDAPDSARVMLSLAPGVSKDAPAVTRPTHRLCPRTRTRA